MLVIAHRGSNREELENSWSAFDRSIETCVDRIELDVYLAEDNSLVVMHDEYLKKIDGSDRHVSQLTRSELEMITLSNGEPLPFLDQVLDKYLHHVSINIEIKPFESPELISDQKGEELYNRAAEAVATLIKKFEYKDRIVVSSFKDTPLIYLSKNYPQIDLACLWYKKLPFFPLSFHKPIRMMQRCKGKFFHPDVAITNRKMVEICHSKGWGVYPYCDIDFDDDEKVWSSLKQMGVDGLCTNYPREFSRWLKENDL